MGNYFQLHQLQVLVERLFKELHKRDEMEPIFSGGELEDLFGYFFHRVELFFLE